MPAGELTQRLSHRLTIGLVSLLVMLAGCASSGDSGDDLRRRDLVVVPRDATAVGSVRWSDVRSIKPLNRRMVIFNTRARPYLLILATPCVGLRPDSIIVTREQFDRSFEPVRDVLEARDPPYTGVDTRVLCRPDALYAIDEEDVDELRAMVE
jgi:hypothetical protein